MNLLLSILGTAVFTSSPLIATANAELNQAKIISTTPSKVLVGYWHNWDNGIGYAGGIARYIDLLNIPKGYNFINVSFMAASTPGQLPTFLPTMPNHPELNQAQKNTLFASQIAQLQQQNRKVILSLGGANGNISLTTDQTIAFKTSILNIVNTFGFDGIDIDLESGDINAADNKTVIPNALIAVKNTLAAQGKYFYITMAPEFPNLRASAYGSYVPYLTKLEGYYDFINPQFYNQGGDGINVLVADQAALNVPNLWWLPQNNTQYKAVFLYLIAKYIMTGEQSNGFYKIAGNKLVWGLPANKDGAADGQIQTGVVKQAVTYLTKYSYQILGMMTWSINWDANSNWNYMNIYQTEFNN